MTAAPRPPSQFHFCLTFTAAIAILALAGGLGRTVTGTESTAPAAESQPAADKLWVYIGTYTKGTKSKGIYRAEYDPKTGALSTPVLAGTAVNPSFLAIHPAGTFLYACDEIEDFGGKKNEGAVSAFALDTKTGTLKLLNQMPSGGGAPCHLICDKAGHHVLAANYSGGSAFVYETLEDGKLGKKTAFVQHEGSGPDKSRQEGPHAHSINLDKANHFVFVADLGLDKVMIYRYDSAKGTLTANDPAFVEVPPKGGPRHFAFHPNGKFAYTNSEMTSAVTALSYDPAKGALKAIETVSTLPKGGFKGNTTAEVQVHPSGKFLYVSNRGHNSIAYFAIDPETGKLTVIGHQGKQIKTPRNFAIDPDGKFLVVANQDSDSLVVFRIDQKTGELVPTGTMVEVPRPVCVRFYTPPV